MVLQFYEVLNKIMHFISITYKKQQQGYNQRGAYSFDHSQNKCPMGVFFLIIKSAHPWHVFYLLSHKIKSIRWVKQTADLSSSVFNQAPSICIKNLKGKVES